MIFTQGRFVLSGNNLWKHYCWSASFQSKNLLKIQNRLHQTLQHDTVSETWRSWEYNITTLLCVLCVLFCSILRIFFVFVVLFLKLLENFYLVNVHFFCTQFACITKQKSAIILAKQCAKVLLKFWSNFAPYFTTNGAPNCCFGQKIQEFDFRNMSLFFCP